MDDIIDAGVNNSILNIGFSIKILRETGPICPRPLSGPKSLLFNSNPNRNWPDPAPAGRWPKIITCQ